MRGYTPTGVNAIKKKYNFRNSKSLGQNFLTDQQIIDKIIEKTYIGPKDLVIEIGPGMGVLTTQAASLARKLIAIEIDKGLLPILAEVLKDYPNTEVIQGDILKTNLSQIIENALLEDPEIANVRILGNLPYYITTPIIMKLLEENVPAETITIMMQKEVAERISSPAGKKAYGAISVAVQYYCHIYPVTTVSKEAFVPVPKVDSAVLCLSPRKEKPVDLIDEKLFFDSIRAGFGQRRKTLGNSLIGLEGLDKEQVKDLLMSVGIDPVRRAETLTIEEFAAVANKLASK